MRWPGALAKTILLFVLILSKRYDGLGFGWFGDVGLSPGLVLGWQWPGAGSLSLFLIFPV
jgi:hypothetical protein